MKRSPPTSASRGQLFNRGIGSAIQVRFGGKFTRGALLLLGLYTASYVLLQLPGVGPFMTDYLLLRPTLALGPRPYQLLTAPLIATDLFSLLFLGLLLWSVGSAVEQRLGMRRFLLWAGLCSLASAVAAAAVGRLIPSQSGVVVPLGPSALFPLVLIGFAQLYGDAQVTMWGIGKPVSGRTVSYFFVGLGLCADLFALRWPHLFGGLAAVLCALLLSRGGTGLGAFWRRLGRRRRPPGGMQVIDGGRSGAPGKSTPTRRQPPHWVN